MGLTETNLKNLFYMTFGQIENFKILLAKLKENVCLNTFFASRDLITTFTGTAKPTTY